VPIQAAVAIAVVTLVFPLRTRRVLRIAMRSHVEAVPDTVREMQNAGPILKIPVLVLTPEKSTPLSDDCLAQIGCRVRQVIAPKSAHWIHLDQPDLVIDSIREMVVATTTETMAVAD